MKMNIIDLLKSMKLSKKTPSVISEALSVSKAPLVKMK